MSFKSFGEGECITVADSHSDLIDIDSGVLKEFDGHLHSVRKEIFLKRVTCSFFKKTSEIASVKSEGHGNGVDLNWL